MPTLLSLPFELLEAIASNLNQRDLSAFVRTNRHLYLSFNYYLYRYNKEHSRGSALLWGVRKGQIRTVQYSIQEGVNLEIKDKQRDYMRGLTPLEIAVCNGNYAITRLLIENGATVSPRDCIVSGPLSIALSESCQKIIGRHESKDELKSKALRAIAQMGHQELVDLVTRKDQVDVISFYGPIWSILVEAISFCETNISIIRLLLEKEAERGSAKTMLSIDAQLGSCDVTLKLLLERKSFFRVRDFIHPYALDKAASYGRKAMINLLLENGANPNDLDRNGRSPLMWAARSGQLEAVKLLLEKGADPNLKPKNETALSLAREGLTRYQIPLPAPFNRKILWRIKPNRDRSDWSDWADRSKLTCWQDEEGKKKKVAKYLLKQGVKK